LMLGIKIQSSMFSRISWMNYIWLKVVRKS